MKTKPLFFLFLFLLGFNFQTQGQIPTEIQPYTYQQSSSIAHPFGAELIDQETKKVNDIELTTYFYRSRLSKEEILQFYRDSFSSQGWREPPYPKELKREDSLIFIKSSAETASLGFLSSSGEEETAYFVTINRQHKMPLWPKEIFKKPRRLDFMPVSGQATEFIYNTYYQPMTGLAYFSPQNIESLREFYLKQMPGFGWNLVDSQSHRGRYEFFQWLKIVNPFTKHLPNLKEIGYDVTIPPLTVEGTTLTFEQGIKTCTITIYNFPDILSDSQNTKWDLWAKDIAKYGKTLICVYYFEK